jgi:molybdenum cofactor biosynthesis enzyme MoaA
MTKRKDDLEEEFGKEFIDCILGKCETNCIYCAEERKISCLKEKELMEKKSEDLPRKRK